MRIAGKGRAGFDAVGHGSPREWREGKPVQLSDFGEVGKWGNNDEWVMEIIGFGFRKISSFHIVSIEVGFNNAILAPIAN